MCCIWCVLFVEVTGKLIELLLPILSVPLHPICGTLHGSSVELAPADAAVARPAHWEGPFQYSQVFRDSRSRHLEGLGKSTDACGAVCEFHQNGPPGGIRKGAKRQVEMMCIRNHMVTNINQ